MIDRSDDRATRGCPCGGPTLARCCGPILEAVREAMTAEELMRSRYSAYALGDVLHLGRTWHPSTVPNPLDLDASVRWTGLEVVATEGGGWLDEEGIVVFRAHYERKRGTAVLSERSRFVRVDRRWVYVDGVSA